MKRNQFLGGLLSMMLVSTLSFGQTTESVQCDGITKSNIQCKNAVNDESELCYIHNPNYEKKDDSTSVICSGTTKSGNPCKSKTKDLSGLCHHHRD